MGAKYSNLPRVMIISFASFKMFDCESYYSDFNILESNRHELLNNILSLRYYELPKLPQKVAAENLLELWLQLFRANTEEDLLRIKETGVPIMLKSLDAYRAVTASEEFQALARIRADALSNEASALADARRNERRKQQRLFAKKIAEQIAAIKSETAAEIANLKEENVQLRSKLNGKK
jgi:predicted transposase/invertase (TIGR01784 family)